MKIKMLLAAFVVAMASVSCSDDFSIDGNGILSSETRSATEFFSVSSEGNFEVYVTFGESRQVMVQAESNLLPLIETEVRNKSLRIYVKGMHRLNNQLPVEVYITVPFLEGLVQSGSGKITADAVTFESFNYVVSGSGSIESMVEAIRIKAVVSGSGNIILSGTVGEAELVLSGPGKIDGGNLAAYRCEARISGSGDIWIDVEHYLQAVISGSGTVFYSGNPYLETVVSGTGGVIHKN